MSVHGDPAPDIVSAESWADGPTSARFGWHPDPELLAMTDPSAREALTMLGRSAWEAGIDFLTEHAARRPIDPVSYPEFRARFFAREGGEPGPAPLHPTPWSALLEDVRARLLPHQFGAQHSGSWAYFTPPALPVSIAGEAIAQWLNQGVDIWACSPSASLVEEEVVAWLRALVGYGPGSAGVLTSGGVMANFMGLAIARDVGLRRLLRLPAAPRGAALERVRVYAGDQAHFSVRRSLAMLGLPSETLRLIPTDERLRLRGEAVAAAIAEDRAGGYLPWCVAAVSGSTNTGSVDAVADLAAVCEREDLWLHVDAAYGGAVRLSQREAWRVPDLELADSVTIDPHKWFFQPYDIGALVVKREEDLLGTFYDAPEYLRTTHQSEEPLDWYQRSFEGTRRFRALKLWLSWRHLGTAGFARLVEANLALADYLTTSCLESDDFEVFPREPELSVVCFRHVPTGSPPDGGADPDVLDRHQVRLQRALEASGAGWVSTTRLGGKTYLRAGIVNYLSSRSDVDRVLGELRRAASSPQEDPRIAD